MLLSEVSLFITSVLLLSEKVVAVEDVRELSSGESEPADLNCFLPCGRGCACLRHAPSQRFLGTGFSP